jgi:hypothetical protein
LALFFVRAHPAAGKFVLVKVFVFVTPRYAHDLP